MSMDTPGWEEFPRYNAEVVSPKLPCGASWLGNCLLELGIPLWQPWDRPTNPLWQRLGPRRYRFIDRHDRVSSWRQTLPALIAGRDFLFHDNIVPKFTHRPEPLTDEELPLILFVRDPRDALYSQWRRDLSNPNKPSLPFRNFLLQIPSGRTTSNMLHLKGFLTNWREQLVNRRHLILHFEGYKTTPDETLMRALEFLGVGTTPKEQKIALLASDFKVAKAVEEHRSRTGPLRAQLCRASVPLEFRTRYTPAMLDLLGEHFDESCSWLGYAKSADAMAMLNTIK